MLTLSRYRYGKASAYFEIYVRRGPNYGLSQPLATVALTPVTVVHLITAIRRTRCAASDNGLFARRLPKALLAVHKYQLVSNSKDQTWAPGYPTALKNHEAHIKAAEPATNPR